MIDSDSFPQLTPRQRSTALGLVHGKTNGQIAKELKISVKTVDTFRGQVLEKLGAKNNVELVHLALFKGYIEVMPIEPRTENPPPGRRGASR